VNSSPLTHNDRDFIRDGGPVQIRSGELHYFRIPRPYWRHRLLMARAMGLNTICIYMPWNLHEPQRGKFDFEGDGGMLDVAGFVRLAGESGLSVIVRPGPYICAEWDFGGLPGWLLEDESLRIRCADETFLDAIRGYIEHVGAQLSPLVAPRGPIVMVQVENEYGSYSNDRAYLRALRKLLRDGGFDDALFFTSDGTDPTMLAAGTLDDCLAVANFGSRAQEHLEKLRAFRPKQPLMCGEFWCGWFDKWGEKRKGSADPAPPAADIQWMIENNASFNLYMLHGGTNFGFTAGANFYEDYSPTVTSYDYWAPIDEAGRPTAKFHALRALLNSKEEMPPPAAKLVPPWAM
jgi:beta-galactosidase